MSSTNPRHRKQAGPPRQSALDTTGGFSQPWTQTLERPVSPRGRAPTVEPGWITMLFVICFIAVTTTLARALAGYSGGASFADVIFTRLSALSSDASHVLFSGVLLTLSFLVFALATRFALARAPACALPLVQGLSLLLFVGPVYFVRCHSVPATWPWLQRISMLMYSVVLSMKLYSFGLVSRSLAQGIPYETDATDLQVTGVIDGRVWTRTLPQPFPDCATLSSIAHFLVRPSLVFTTVTLRLESVSISYLVEKAAMAGGAVLLALDLVERFIVPAWKGDLPLWLCVGEIAPSMTVVMLCCFFATFECVLNAAAEVTQIAERTHYGPWWSSTSFVDFSRSWNLPVHHWLVEHIYKSTGLGRTAALVLTFAVSITIHEIIIWSSLGSQRYSYPWLAAASLCQFPLAPLLKTPPFKGTRLGNIFFWMGLSIGISLITTLYARGGVK